MHSASLETPDQRIKLLIVCLRSDLAKIRLLVNRHALGGWETNREIQVLPVADTIYHTDSGPKHTLAERKVKVLRRIADLAPSESAARILIARSTRILLPDEKGKTRDEIYFGSCEDLEKILPDLLWHCGLDWFSAIRATIQHYYQHQDGQLEQWLKQFSLFERQPADQKLKSREKQKFAWMGNALLQMLDFWPAPRVADAIFASNEGEDCFANSDLIAYNDPSKGGSGSVIARLLAKRLPDLRDKIFPLPELAEVLRKGKTKRRILFLEDCIMTGDECIKLLQNELKDVASGNSITFKFAVSTAFGTLRLRNYIRRMGLNQTSVIESASGHINNLSTDAQTQADRLFDGAGRLLNPDKSLINGIELRGKRFLSVDQRRTLCWFCRTVGKQLMFHYFQSKGDSAAAANDKAAENNLGFGNLGLMIAFAHGVPDNSLPLFRCGGEVSVNGQTVDWIPLFPNAVGA